MEFKEIFNGTFVTETMLIDGMNDNEDELIKIAHFVVKVDPEIAYLTIPTRPTLLKIFIVRKEPKEKCV